MNAGSLRAFYRTTVAELFEDGHAPQQYISVCYTAPLLIVLVIETQFYKPETLAEHYLCFASQ